MSAQEKKERRRMQLLASKATFRSDPAKRAAELDKRKKSERKIQRRLCNEGKLILRGKGSGRKGESALASGVLLAISFFLAAF